MSFWTISLLSLSLAFSAVAVQAADSCDLPQLDHQQKDAATIRNLENAWSVAFLRGDTRFMQCLLIPEFTEITRSGKVKFLSDELAMTAENLGKNRAIPDLPTADVLLHDNVAVAYGESHTPTADGKVIARRFADSFVWENGRWHAFFSQQTQVEQP